MNSHTLDKKNHRHELYIKKSLSQIDIYNADKSYEHGIAYSLVIDGHEIRRYVKPRLFADRFSVRFDDRLVTIDINLNLGTSHATVMTNDLSHDYVHENSAYAT